MASLSSQNRLNAFNRLIDNGSLIIYVLLALGLILIKEFGAAKNLFLYGTIRDTDDALRLVQIRDLIAGQNWFDLHHYRMNPPTGVLMHWSRLIDAPVAALILFFGFFTNSAMAEALARFVWPASLQIGLFVVMLMLTRRLAGKTALFAAAVLLGFSYIVMAQFEPGRIDHHNVQLLLSALLVLFTFKAEERPSFAALAGLAAAAMMAIGFETLSVVAIAIVYYGFLWVAMQPGSNARLQYFGLGFSLSSIALFFATTPASLYLATACDAQSFISVLFAAGAGAASLLLASFSSVLKSPFSRFNAGLLAAALLMFAIYPFAGQCLSGPFSAVPAELRYNWLDRVFEARGLGQHLGDDFYSTLPFAGTLAVSVTCVIAAFVFNPLQTWRFGLLAALTLVHAALTFMHLRIASLAILFSIPACAWCVTALRIRSQPAMAILYLLCIPAFWALPAMYFGPKMKATISECGLKENYAAIAALPPAHILAPVDLGSHLLAFTHHSVYGAPYHRNVEGMSFVLHTLYAEPVKAYYNLLEKRPQYILLCEGLGELRGIGQVPDNLAMNLMKGNFQPGIYTPVPIPKPMYLWRITYSFEHAQ